MGTRKCARTGCGKAFEPAHGAQKFCSGRCVKMHRNAYHKKRRAGKELARAECAICGKQYEKRGNRKTCSPECSEELNTKYHQKYYDKDVKSDADADADADGSGKWSKYRETATRKRIEAAGTVSRTCVICGNAFETHDRRRKTCSRACSTANSSGPAAVREAVLAAVAAKSKSKSKAEK